MRASDIRRSIGSRIIVLGERGHQWPQDATRLATDATPKSQQLLQGVALIDRDNEFHELGLK